MDRAKKSAWRRWSLVLAAGGLVPFLGGCETDSFLFDPSVLGRWERTPTSVPILDRIASIEGPEDDWVEFTDPTPADLVPELAEYRIGPGDRLGIVIFDLPEDGKAVPYDKVVDTRGHIELPQLGSINVSGQTVSGAERLIQEAMSNLVRSDPLASVDVTQPRQQIINLVGSVQRPGPFPIPVADFRLLEALAAAGWISEAPDYIYIIRQTPLTDAVSGQPKPAAQPAGPSAPPGDGENLIDLIDQLSKPPEGPATPPPAPSGTPAATSPERPAGSPGVFQPEQPAAQPTGQPAPIDLIDPTRPAPKPAPIPEPDSGEATWVHLDGKWVKVRRPQPTTLTAAGTPAPASGEGYSSLVTQRILRIPVTRLVNGDARVNVVVRPGDIIRVPPPPSGFVYMGGQVNRGGVYGLAQGLTLQRALISAGGLTSIAVPERTDLKRMVGPDREAIIRLNLRAIAEGTHPDIFLKPNDVINVGSNFWAVPLAVIRNGFRASYGFGLLIDRNFGNDIFGVPPGEEGFF